MSARPGTAIQVANDPKEIDREQIKSQFFLHLVQNACVPTQIKPLMFQFPDCGGDCFENYRGTTTVCIVTCKRTFAFVRGL